MSVTRLSVRARSDGCSEWWLAVVWGTRRGGKGSEVTRRKLTAAAARGDCSQVIHGRVHLHGERVLHGLRHALHPARGVDDLPQAATPRRVDARLRQVVVVGGAGGVDLRRNGLDDVRRVQRCLHAREERVHQGGDVGGLEELARDQAPGERLAVPDGRVLVCKVVLESDKVAVLGVSRVVVLEYLQAGVVGQEVGVGGRDLLEAVHGTGGRKDLDGLDAVGVEKVVASYLVVGKHGLVISQRSDQVMQSCRVCDILHEGKVGDKAVDLQVLVGIKLELVVDQGRIGAATSTAHGEEEVRIVALVDGAIDIVCSDDVEFHGVVDHESVGWPESAMSTTLSVASGEADRADGTANNVETPRIEVVVRVRGGDTSAHHTHVLPVGGGAVGCSKVGVVLQIIHVVSPKGKRVGRRRST